VVATLILSAGLGTRLAPLSSWRAKPLVPVGDRPAIAHIVERVRPASRVVVVNAHHRADEVERYARDAGLVVSREPDLLGTAGGIAFARDLLGAGDVLVWNGDMLGDLDVPALLGAHARHAAGGALATLVVRSRPDGAGNTGLDERGDVVRLRQTSCRLGEARTADFLGVYVVGEALRRALAPRGDIIAETLLPLIRAGARVAAFGCDAPFLDIGTPRAYLEANLRWLGPSRFAGWTGEGAGIDAGIRLDRTVVGAGARVRGEGALVRCVVWPGAEVHAPRADVIVAVEGEVSVPESMN
jgi:mannose-1-phosphate guanylyltransferase